LTNRGGKVRVGVYDAGGKMVGIVPNDRTSFAFRRALKAFANVESPDSDGVVAPL
jgi:hypothetical protein